MTLSCFAESDSAAVQRTADITYGDITIRTNSRHKGTAAPLQRSNPKSNFKKFKSQAAAADTGKTTLKTLQRFGLCAV